MLAMLIKIVGERSFQFRAAHYTMQSRSSTSRSACQKKSSSAADQTQKKENASIVPGCASFVNRHCLNRSLCVVWQSFYASIFFLLWLKSCTGRSMTSWMTPRNTGHLYITIYNYLSIYLYIYSPEHDLTARYVEKIVEVPQAQPSFSAVFIQLAAASI